jgi:hypothetical protein
VAFFLGADPSQLASASEAARSTGQDSSINRPEHLFVKSPGDELELEDTTIQVCQVILVIQI